MGGDEWRERIKFATFEINFEDIDERVTYKREPKISVSR
jgi:hypothetical protein